MKIRVLGTIGSSAKQLGWLLLRYGARTFYGIENPEILRGENGKPYLRDRAFYFNISHSGSFALCAFGNEPVGADIEEVKPRRAGLERRILSEEEQVLLARAKDPEAALITFWTLKESYLKYTGTGLREEPRTVSFSPREDGTALCSVPGPFFRWYRGDGVRAALCAGEDRLPKEITWVPQAALFEKAKENEA